MKREHNWVLDFCSPMGWPIDLTPPQGDWDRDIPKGSPEEIIFKLESSSPALTQFINMISIQAGKTLTAAAVAMSQVADAFAKAVNENWGAVKPWIEVNQELDEMELARHGTFVVRSQNPKIDLPVRKFNCGPPIKRLDRRRK